MKKPFSALINKLPESTSWVFWITLAILIKSLFAYLKYRDVGMGNSVYIGTFAADGGDTYSYIEPIENLLKNGEYYDDYRMPGYGWLYYIFRLFFSNNQSLNFLAITQIIFSGISTYALGLIAKQLFGSKNYFIAGYALYVASTFVSLYDLFLGTESFCVSTTVISFYYLLSDKKNNYFLAGLFITWSIFLRPIMAPLLIVFGLFIFFKDIKNIQSRWVFILKKCTLFALPFILIDGLWINHNLKKHHVFVPLTRTVFYPGTSESYLGTLFEFMYSFGGSIVWWEPGSDITYFKQAPSFIKKKVEAKLPSYIYTSAFNADSLLILKHDILKIESEKLGEFEKQQLTEKVKLKLSSYTNSIKREKPFLFYVGSRLRVLKTFLIHPGTYNLFNAPSFELKPWQYALKVFYSLLYLTILMMGTIGCFILLFMKRNKPYLLLFALTTLYLMLAYPIIFKLDQSRYFVTAYPFFLLSSLPLLAYLKLKFNTNDKIVRRPTNL